MYVLGGFRLPPNVICLNGMAVEKDLLLNKEPPGTPLYLFPQRPITGVLINREQRDVRGLESEFSIYLAEHAGPATTIANVQYRLPFAPFARFLRPRGFMIRSAGGELVSVAAAAAPLTAVRSDAPSGTQGRAVRR
jgi:hypothetical protein